MIANCIDEKPLPIYGEGLNVRDWLFVKDHCRAIYTVLSNGIIGETYNIGGNNEIKNIDIVKSICNYKGINVVLMAPGEYTSDSDFDSYIEKELNRNESYWNICSMHNELHSMEAERKPGKTGMEVF